jgi:acetyl esterase/lipase
MITQTIPLREDSQTVYLETYALQSSPQFQTGTRRPAVIVCPGGAYVFISDREGEPVALRFLAQGYHAFVLRYSVQTRFLQPMHDLAKAMQIVRANADEWLLDPDQIAVCGFSAGGHLAASLGVLWNQPWLTESLGVSAEAIRPNALILGYPVIDLELVDNTPTLIPGLPVLGLELVDNTPTVREQQTEPVRLKELMLTTVLGEPDQALKDRYRLDRHVSSATPPTFIWHTADDDFVFAHNALRFATALVEHKVPYELHIFGSGVHGLSLADETTAAQEQQLNPHAQIWIDLALKWLKRRREQARSE